MKKLLQFLYIPLILFLLVPMVTYLSFFIPYFPTQTIALAIYIFLGGFALSKIESKKIKILSCVITSIIFILFGIYIAYYRYIPDATAMPAYVFIPITYFESFFIYEETILTSVLYVIFAPLPVVISGLSSLIFKLDDDYKKMAKILISVILAVVTFLSVIITIHS